MYMKMQCVVMFLILFSAAAWAQQPSLRINLGTISDNRVPLMIAQEEGLFRKNGLDLQLFVTPAAAEAVKADGITVNPRYIGPANTTPSPISFVNGAGLIYARATNANASADQVTIATLEPAMRYLVVAQPEITEAEQLKGKRWGVAVPGGLSHLATLAVVDRMGWDPVQDVSLMLNGPTIEALKSRRVDAVVVNELRHAMFTAAGFKTVVDTRPWNVPLPGTGVVVSRAWLRDNRETARRFTRSLVEALALMKKDKEVAFLVIANWWGITDPQRREMIYAGVADMPSKPYPSVEGIKKAMQLHDSNEMRKYKPEEFYDDSLVRELDQSGFIDGLYR